MMDNMDKYLPNADMQAAFEKFKELKTAEGKTCLPKGNEGETILNE